MIPVEGLSRSAMVQAASRRATVTLRNGTSGRLIRWAAPHSRNRARLEIRPGVYVSVPCSEVSTILPPDPD